MQLSLYQFSDTNYVNNKVMIDDDPSPLVKTLARVESSCDELRLHVSGQRPSSKYGSGPPAQNAIVEGRLVKGVERVTYLGSQVSLDNGSRNEQLRRTGNTAIIMQNLSHVWIDSHLSFTYRL